jgi:hypothetical protein
VISKELLLNQQALAHPEDIAQKTGSTSQYSLTRHDLNQQ